LKALKGWKTEKERGKFNQPVLPNEFGGSEFNLQKKEKHLKTGKIFKLKAPFLNPIL